MKFAQFIIFFLLFLPVVSAIDFPGTSGGFGPELVAIPTLRVDYANFAWGLPTEGTDTNVTFFMQPAPNSAINSLSLEIHYEYSPPNGQNRTGRLPVETAPYSEDREYAVTQIIKFDIPGIWELKYWLEPINKTMKLGSEASDVKIERIHVYSVPEVQGIVNGQNSVKISFFGVLGTLLAAFLGVLVTLGVTHYTQDRKETLINQEKIYAPLLDDIERLKLQTSSLDDRHEATEWNKLVQNHLVFRITPHKLKKTFENLHTGLLHNFFKVCRRNAFDEVKQKILTDFTINGAQARKWEKYITALTHFVIHKNAPQMTFEASSGFPEFKTDNRIIYATLSELDNDFGVEIRQLPVVKELFEKQAELFKTLNLLTKQLNKKLGLPNESGKATF